MTLTKLGYPDKFAPVLSDDTDDPWAEKNNISGALTLGYLLFESPKMGYFANKEVEAKMFWYVTDKQLKMLDSIESKSPTMKSVDFPTTGYFIMREGWNLDDKMMIISAGLDADKPDHQHGDMLGVQAVANRKVILPNYQVRYSLKDLELFKNSMTKNVALVDNELQGKQYTSNKGGSGFGKFKELPNPKIIAWETNKGFDFFAGSHDGFENVGVDYSRQVIYLKDDFWIVKDNFKSENAHTYKQVWQGHYSLENSPNLIRSTFDNASGLDIFQLNKIDEVSNSGQRGKGWSTISINDQSNFNFITILYPYNGYANRIDENSDNLQFKDWELNNTKWEITGHQPQSISKDNTTIFFSVIKLQYNKINIKFSNPSDVYVNLNNDELVIYSLSDKDIEMEISGNVENGVKKILPGNKMTFDIIN